MGRPINTSGDMCPLWRKDVKKVCHTCPWYQEVKGMNPNTGEAINKWDCAIAWFPLLQTEVSKEVRQGAAATESFRNELVGLHTDGVNALSYAHQKFEQRQLESKQEPKLINGKVESPDRD